MRRRKLRQTPSRTSPTGGKRGCLCPDGKYSRKCCNGSLLAQGIGLLYRLWNDIWNKNETEWRNAEDDWEAGN